MGASAARNCNPSCWLPLGGRQPVCSNSGRVLCGADSISTRSISNHSPSEGRRKATTMWKKLITSSEDVIPRRLWAIRDRNPVLTHRIREVQRKYVYRLCIGGWEV